MIGKDTTDKLLAKTGNSAMDVTDDEFKEIISKNFEKLRETIQIRLSNFTNQ